LCRAVHRKQRSITYSIASMILFQINKFIFGKGNLGRRKIEVGLHSE
jgi:hypothetical protein